MRNDTLFLSPENTILYVPLVDRTGPPQKTAVQLAAGGGKLEVLEELARYTTQADWLVRQAVSTSHSV